MSFNRNNFGPQDRGFDRGGFGQSSRLPFDHVQMDQRNFITNTRDIPDFKIPFDFGEYDITVYEALIAELQKPRHPLFVFGYNLYSANGYRNKDFQHLVMVYAAYLVVKFEEFPRVDPPELIFGEAGFVVNAAVAALCLIPGVDQLVEPSMDREIEAAIDSWKRLEDNFERMTSRGGRGLGGGGNYQPSRGLGGGLGSYPQQSTGLQGPGINQSVAAKLYQPMNNQRQSAHTQTYQGVRMSQQEPQSGQPVRAPLGVLIDKQATPPPTPINQVINPAPEPNTTGTATSSSQDKSYLPRNDVKVRSIAQMYNRREEPDGSIVVPAIHTGLTPDYDPEHPPVVYNRRSAVLFHVKGPDGKIRERIEESNPDMDYLRHELDSKLKQIHEDNQALFNREVVVPTLLDTRPLIPTQNGVIAFKANEEQRKQLDEAGAPRTILRPIRADNLSDAKFKARMELARLGLDSDTEYLEYQVEEIALATQEPGTREIVHALKTCLTFEELRDEILNLQKTDMISDAFSELLDKRITTSFLRYTQRALNIPLKIDSFIVDYDDFLAEVKKLGERITRKFEEGIKVVSTQALMILPSDATIKYLEESGEVSDEVKENLPAIFVNRYSITELPWSGADMALAWRLEGVVTPENAKHFHEALTAIFARTRSNDVFEHILLTDDDQSIYSYAAPLAEGNFIITTKKPKEPKSFFERMNDAGLNKF